MSTTWSVIQCQTTLSTFRRKKGSMKLKTRLFDYWGNENWYWQHETKCDKNEGYIHLSKISVQLVSIATTFFYTVLYSIRMRFSWSKIWVIVQYSSSNTSGVIMGKSNVNVNISHHHIGLVGRCGPDTNWYDWQTYAFQKILPWWNTIKYLTFSKY